MLILRMRSPCVVWRCQEINLPAGLRVNRLARDATIDAIRKAHRVLDHDVSYFRDVKLVDFRE